ncbi:MAG TPA: MCE family protein [Acidimicrobiales bacterium]|nr:MCE family protein [Acidimicrobiales bacterium]
MITRRIVVNLITFGIISAVLIAYGFLNLLGNPLRDTTTVSSVFPTASGLSPGFTVTLDGVPVGTVSSVTLVQSGAKVTMSIDPGNPIPDNVQARVIVANALGEQEVELAPPAGAADPPALKSGAVIPAATDSTPADVGTVVAEFTKLVAAIPPGDLNTVLHEVATAVDGRGGDLRTIAESSRLYSQEFLSYQQQFQSLLDNSPSVLNTVSANSTALQQGLSNTAVLVGALAQHRQDLVDLLAQGSTTAAQLDQLVVDNRPDLGCLVHDLADVNQNIGNGSNLTNLDATLAMNQIFFGAVGRVAVVGHATALTAGDSARNTQEWLRTRLLLPPAQPSAIAYSPPTTLPPVLPGAACSTEFGAGVGAATQDNFQPSGPQSRVSSPSAAAADVRGGGAEPTPSAPAAERAPVPAGSGAAMALLAALLLLGWVVTLANRRTRGRSARPEPLAVEVKSKGARRR